MRTRSPSFATCSVKADAIGCHVGIATGHYARTGGGELLRGLDHRRRISRTSCGASIDRCCRACFLPVGAQTEGGDEGRSGARTPDSRSSPKEGKLRVRTFASVPDGDHTKIIRPAIEATTRRRCPRNSTCSFSPTERPSAPATRLRAVHHRSTTRVFPADFASRCSWWPSVAP